MTPHDGRTPHVVMLVDNPVVGDSRVQKQARSMLDRGWQVTLVGRRERPRAPVRTEFDGVPAHMVRVRFRTGRHPRVERSTLLRNPLALPSPRQQHLVDLRADVAVARATWRLDEAEAAGATGARLLVARAGKALARARRHVVDSRVVASEVVRENRRTGAGPVDRAVSRVASRLLGDDLWEHGDPTVWDWEIAYGPVVDQLAPDLIHANDHRMLHVAARAKARAAARGRSVRVVWDAHEYIPGIASWSSDLRWKPAQVALERRVAPFADAVVTVSDTLAAMLQEAHDLSTRPAVVLNAPQTHRPGTAQQDVRSACGLAADVPLVVYSGGAAPQRGLDVLVEAMPLLPDVHTALVVLRTAETVPGDYVRGLQDRAAELGVGDRLHVLPYVKPDEVVPFLAGADVGVFPGLRYLNHEISLITKFMEYSHARLPIVVSDLRTMAGVVRDTGQGEVFEPGDVHGYATAVGAVLDDKATYQRAYDDAERMAGWSWERQADILDAVYRDVMGRPADRVRATRGTAR